MFNFTYVSLFFICTFSIVSMFVVFKICGWVADYKFTVMLKEPESIHNMERIPLWLKCLVRSRYGQHIKRYSSKFGVEAVERSIERREMAEEIRNNALYITFGEFLLEEEQECAKRKLSAYRCIWTKMEG